LKFFTEKSKFVKKVEEMKKKEEEISVKVASVLNRNIETDPSNPTQGLFSANSKLISSDNVIF
jgi:hypothetical protein